MRLRVLCLGVLLVLGVPGTSSGAPVHPAAAATTLQPLLDTVAERIDIADLVAAAKFPDQPITDSARERQVLDDAATRGAALGLAPAYVRAFFSDEIEAAKVVEYGLFSRWSAHPGQAPTTRPDLGEIRTRLDAVTGRLLHGLVSTSDTRASAGCPPRLRVAEALAGVRHRVDALHAEGLHRAVPSVCTGGRPFGPDR